MSLKIEKLESCASGTWGHFVSVYKNGKCIGTVMTDGTMTPNDCYDELVSKWETDKAEKRHDSNLLRAGV